MQGKTGKSCYVEIMLYPNIICRNTGGYIILHKKEKREKDK
jgi:hypothetical protein